MVVRGRLGAGPFGEEAPQGVRGLGGGVVVVVVVVVVVAAERRGRGAAEAAPREEPRAPARALLDVPGRRRALATEGVH